TAAARPKKHLYQSKRNIVRRGRTHYFNELLDCETAVTTNSRGESYPVIQGIFPVLSDVQRLEKTAWLTLNFFLQQRNRIKKLFRPRRAPRHIHIHGNHLV